MPDLAGSRTRGEMRVEYVAHGAREIDTKEWLLEGMGIFGVMMLNVRRTQGCMTEVWQDW